jgi:hypothetical protein
MIPNKKIESKFVFILLEINVAWQLYFMQLVLFGVAISWTVNFRLLKILTTQCVTISNVKLFVWSLSKLTKKISSDMP